jgi:hypothetical protein
METTAPTTEGRSQLDQTAETKRSLWWSGLPTPEKHEIIKKAFEERYPTNDAKRKALAPYS